MSSELRNWGSPRDLHRPTQVPEVRPGVGMTGILNEILLGTLSVCQQSLGLATASSSLKRAPSPLLVAATRKKAKALKEGMDLPGVIQYSLLFPKRNKRFPFKLK